MALESIDPTNGEVVARYEETPRERLAAIVESVHEAYESWSRTSFSERAARLREAARLLRERQTALAELVAREMGKVLAEGRAEAAKCAAGLEHFAEHGERMLADEPVATEAKESFTTYRPLGVVLAVMPWNFPLWQVFRFAAPALMAGNGAVLKHASNVSGSALAIESVLRDAGFPRDLFRTVLVPSSAVESLIEHRRVRAVTLTGSTPAGRAVASAAGHALKKTVLELGGSDPYVVLSDADLERAVSVSVASRLINAGQSCIAAKRFIVPRSVLAEYTERFVEAMRAKRMGHPCDEGSDLGPQARQDLRDELHRQVRASVDRGARLLLGGTPPQGPGAWYPPTVLADVSPGMPAHDEELFGPVAAIVPVRDDEEAIATANASSFGLGAAVFTRDLERGRALAAERLEAGSCFVNDFVRSDPRLPFGGIKDSGYGRELGTAGIREFVNVKTVWVSSGSA